MTRPTRKYTRLKPSVWAEIRALWEVGDVTLPDLAENYRVNTRTLQAHFAKYNVEKGSKAAALATSVKAEIYASTLGRKDLTVERGRETREAAYEQACLVEGLVMRTLSAMEKDPAKTLGLSSTLKALALAAASFERTHGLKLKALGLDKDLPVLDELPVLIFRDLSEDEIKARQDSDEGDEVGLAAPTAPLLAFDEEDDGPNHAEDEDIVVEGEEAPSVDKGVLTDAAGCRLVRGALP